MNSLRKFINLTLVSLSCLVAAIFIFGHMKPRESRIDQSSTSGKIERSISTQDELTNKYMKELQNKLKKEEVEAFRELKKVQEAKKLQRPKDDDWSKVPLDQQISKETPFDGDRDTAASRISLNKENAAEFIETARKNGYHVILSDNYEVLSVTPIINTKNLSDSFESNPAQ